MAPASCANKYPLLMNDTSSHYLPYPAPLAKHEEVVANPRLFMATLEKLHASMGTKFMTVMHRLQKAANNIQNRR
ncbi:hypothetical protein L3X38_026072 [Prunus dulcis]|uniref:Uncharacterized protein n=1 Tax=Prunus dulcis TaxID=3755 RepID=A0AAD4W419_PRUDU|nr:hypothetical protein L3X38_026072 [Prunus dulcis]